MHVAHDATAAGAQAGNGRPILDVKDKATGERLATVGLAAVSDVDEAVASAARAQASWAEATHVERANVLRAAAVKLTERASRLRELIVRETGCIAARPTTRSARRSPSCTRRRHLRPGRWRGPAVPPTSAARRWSERVAGGADRRHHAMELPAGARHAGDRPGPRPRQRRAAQAVAGDAAQRGVASPNCSWPPERRPGSCSVLPGVRRVGERLVAHPGIAMIHFTGSTKVGRRIATTAGGLLKKVSLELGGNNALLVLDDADVEQARSSGRGPASTTRARPASPPDATSSAAALRTRTSPRSPTAAERIVLGDPSTDPSGSAR